MRSSRFVSLLLLALVAGGCQKSEKADPSGKPPPAKDAGGAGVSKPGPAVDLDSKEILARTEVADEADVKHVLIGWAELAPAYRGGIDPRASKRDNAAAASLAKEVVDKLRADPASIDKLITGFSEDPGSLELEPYNVTAASRFVPQFKQLALRLKVGEVGVVKTDYGYHVMVRVAPPPPDPLESADILARPAKPGAMQVQHILIGWKDVPAAKKQPGDPRAATRTKEEADKLATEVLAKVRAGGDMAKLMKEYSEDPGSKDSATPYDVSADAQLVEPFKKLSMRLDIGEAGLVKTVFGWHIIKRIPPPPPPPPDSLESAKILAREPVTAKAEVKHILLGWTEKNAGDPRGTARSRADLEKLVKKTMARLAKGEKIEALMAELSEDPGSAKTGNSYPVTPDAGLVPPFKNLSLRLEVGEVGAVKTDYGIHIIKRIE